MSDRYPYLPSALVAMRRVVNETKLQLTEPDCARLARVVFEVIPTKKWFVGVCIEQQEFVAAAGLREQGYVAYLPKTFSRRQNGRRFEAVPQLRLPGYILVAFDPDRDPWGPINSTPGMDDSSRAALICSVSDDANRPIALPPGIIEGLRKVEDEDYARAAARKKPMPRKDLLPGETVEINKPDDRFHGKRGIYLGSERFIAKVLLGAFIKDIGDIFLRKIDQEQGEEV